MSNQQFTILYNGRPAVVTVLEDEIYMVQITYKPLRIRLQKNHEGARNFVDVETGNETSLTHELGRLIHERVYASEEA